MQSSKESRWVLAMGCVVLAFTGCEGGVSQPPLETAGTGGGSVNPPVETGGATGATLGQARCQGSCCPTAAECFPLGNPSEHSGAECLAQRDNTGQKHWQFRQTLSVSTEPPGTAVAAIANVLVTASELPWPACSSSTGTSGFIQLIDIDTEHDTARFGFATYVTDVPAAVRDGLCMVEDSYADVPESVLPAIAGRPDGWPDGMPLPLRLPFAVKPTLGVRYKDKASGALRDFDLATERADILKRLDKDTGDLKDYDGVYFLDEERGYLHGYSPLAFISNYSSPTLYNAIPIRESEIKTLLNDHAHPNCAGAYLGDNLPATCKGDSTTRAWGSLPAGSQTDAGPTSTTGYFLVEEMEQIKNGLLNQSLCYLMAGANGYPGWTISGNCRSDVAHFHAEDRVNGFPPGNWCSKENVPASAAKDKNCHDALHSVSSATLQAFPIQETTCKIR